MSKALTNSLALLQEIKSQLAAGDTSERVRYPLSTLLDRRSPQSPQHKSRTRYRTYDLPRGEPEAYSTKGHIRPNQKPSRVYDLLKQARDIYTYMFRYLYSYISEQFDSFIDRIKKKHDFYSSASVIQ